jgi:hypothetical protein
MMAAGTGGPDDVDAPEGAIAWTPGDGFISDPDQLAAALRDGLAGRIVEAGVIRGVDGTAPLAALIRVERQLADAHDEIALVYERLLDTAEYATDRFAASR